MENRAAFSDTDVTGKSHTLLVGCSENCRQTRDSRVVCRVERKVTIRDKLVHGELKRQQPFEGRTRIQPAKTSWPGRSSGFLDMSIVTSRENILNQESHGQVFGRPIQYPRDRLDSKEENRSTGIFIAASHDLGVPCNLVPSPVGKEVGACIVCCVLIVAFDRGRSFIDLKFDFSFFASPSQCPDETENRNQRHGAGLCVYGVTQVAASRSAVGLYNRGHQSTPACDSRGLHRHLVRLQKDDTALPPAATCAHAPAFPNTHDARSGRRGSGSGPVKCRRPWTCSHSMQRERLNRRNT
jgi:hypothetical protein